LLLFSSDKIWKLVNREFLCAFYASVMLLMSIIYPKMNAAQAKINSKSGSYYFSSSGSDLNNGSIHFPFHSISKLNGLRLQAGDKVYFRGTDVFKGNILIDSSSFGTVSSPVMISSYGGGEAIIDGGDLTALTIYHTRYITLSNLKLTGSGRKNGNRKNGVMVQVCKNIIVKNIDVSGFQKAGLLIYSSSDILAGQVYAHDNGAAGIAIEGNRGKKNCRNIQILNCFAENNPGDPANLNNHSGNGIVAAHCTSLLIDHCTATNNGWDMPRTGNGPVGIWCFESDSVIIQHCLSYRNKTSNGGGDGGGFDLDGGVTNSLVQYNLSYENQGSGYGIFQYWGATPWYHNVIRYNISENDGAVSDSKAGIYIWNSSGDAGQFRDCLVYNNTIYNSSEAAISFSEKSERKRFRFYNNIFVGKRNLIKGDKGKDVFIGNNWWSLTEQFNADGIKDFSEWAVKYQQEMLSGKITGYNLDPQFPSPGGTVLTSFLRPGSYDKYKIPGNSLLRDGGPDLKIRFGIDTGDLDFNQKPAPAKGIGACF
jgi:hypothetical protein